MKPHASSPDLAELTVYIRPFRLHLWEYEGTRAQLEAEAVIPPGTEWPEADGRTTWEARGFRFMLCRTRPPNVKGRRKAWAHADWWCLSCEFIAGPDPATLRAMDLERERQATMRRFSLQGQADERVERLRLTRARADSGFQTFFKALMPAKARPGEGGC